MNKLNSSIGKKYKVTEIKEREYFNWSKFNAGFFGLLNPIGWIKDLVSLFNLRKLLIYALILGAVLGYGYWKGLQQKPVTLDLGYGQETIIELTKDSQLHIYKDGAVYLEDREGNKLKRISVKDIPSLKRQLAPYRFQFKPVGIIGGSLSDYGESGGEAGAGLSFFRAWRMQLETFLTNRGAYLGTSYSLEQIGLKNSGVGMGLGKGYHGDNRAIVYFRMNF